MSDKKKGWDLSIVLALVAVMISVCTMIISLVETSIMQKQQQSMTESSKASVWPYLSSYVSTSMVENQEIEYKLYIENKGVGPALTKKLEIHYDGKPIEISLLDVLRIHCPDAKASNILLTNTQNMILSPAEKKILVSLRVRDADFMKFALFTEKVDLKYCYSNIYDDIWVSTDDTPMPSKKCN